TASPGTSAVQLSPNRRRHERVPFLTAVVAIFQIDDRYQCVRCQSDDLSFEGARLVCFEPLGARSVFLRILMPGLSEQFVESEIISERSHAEVRAGRASQTRFVYGLRFRRVVTDPDLAR